ncbi:MAG: NAD(P)-dependent oxidoreductase [Deltaproteobacteria bacterium]|nr:NAD(P)-dependent oxidoreductase [Deltaproteobacteria bacterium]
MVSIADKFKKMDKGFSLAQAVAEADRCLLCHDAPCSEGCPADTDPGAFIRKFRFKNITGAIRTIKENNILGGACGVLCPTAKLCEKACSATGIGRPIEIGNIQRFLVEYAWDMDFKPLTVDSNREEKIAVVGSGPAGMSCAAELAKAGFHVTVFEARPEPGGVLRYGVPSYRFDLNFLEREISDIKALGVEFECDKKIEGSAGAEELLDQGFDSVFIAPGLWDSVRLRENEDKLEGLYSSVSFLAALREGRFDELSSQFEGKAVAVVGGGSVAMDCVCAASKLNASDVYLVYRRSYAQMPAEMDERLEALEEGVHFLLLNQPVDYIVEDSYVRGLKLVRTVLGERDHSGRRRPENIEGSEWILKADVVIQAIGNKADEASPEWYPNVLTDNKKLVQVDEKSCATSVAGIFAGGDIIRGPDLVVNAVQDGKKAAKAIEKYLKK